jgi:hypothetical protein
MNELEHTLQRLQGAETRIAESEADGSEKHLIFYPGPD